MQAGCFAIETKEQTTDDNYYRSVPKFNEKDRKKI